MNDLTAKAHEIFAADRFASELTGIQIATSGDHEATCTLTIETQEGITLHTMPACNHFEEEMRYFVANYATSTEAWRTEFLNQTRTLMRIKECEISEN